MEEEEPLIFHDISASVGFEPDASFSYWWYLLLLILLVPLFIKKSSKKNTSQEDEHFSVAINTVEAFRKDIHTSSVSALATELSLIFRTVLNIEQRSETLFQTQQEFEKKVPNTLTEETKDLLKTLWNTEYEKPVIDEERSLSLITETSNLLSHLKNATKQT